MASSVTSYSDGFRLKTPQTPAECAEVALMLLESPQESK